MPSASDAFDAGHTQIHVTYTGEKEDVIVRMYGGKLTVSNSKVTVYGFIGNIDGKEKIIAGKGSIFHKDIDDTGFANADNGSFGENHLFGEDGNTTLCLVEGCGQANSDHVCVYKGKYKVEPIENDESKKSVTLLCDICGMSMGTIEIEGEVIEQPKEDCDHDWKDKGEIKATCTTPGMKVQVCIICGGINSYEIEPALGHDWQDHEGKDATCEEAGYTAIRPASAAPANIAPKMQPKALDIKQ